MKFNSALFLTCLLVAFIFPSKALKQGFTTELIHRDSPLSPLYNSSLNYYDRIRLSIERSMSRIDRFRQSKLTPNDVSSQVQFSGGGGYTMAVYIGTPPVLQLGIVDTGSDLIWTQCKPCVQCYQQKLPMFDPKKSSTYQSQSCDSQACQELSDGQRVCYQGNECGYKYGYGDGSRTLGFLSTETLSFSAKDGADRSSLSYPGIAFGCGHKNSGTFQADLTGIIGLGGGPLSLVSQLGSSIGGKFSYCLIPFAKQGNFTSKISFGTIGEVTGPGVISTPLSQSSAKTFYYLTLEGISVSNKRIPFYKKSSSSSEVGYEEGNIIIDSGTTLTFLPPEMYSDLSSALQSTIEGQKVDDPSGNLPLCYESANGGADLNIPAITAHFKGGDVVLPYTNTFVEVSNGVVCFAMVPANSEVGAIFGNLSQMNFLVGYDNEEGKVNFKPTDCTKWH